MQKLLVSATLLGLLLSTAPVHAQRSQSHSSGSYTKRSSSSSQTTRGDIHIQLNPNFDYGHDRYEEYRPRPRRQKDYFTLTNNTGVDLVFTLTSNQGRPVEEIIYAGETHDFPVYRRGKMSINRRQFSISKVTQHFRIEPGKAYRLDRAYGYLLRFYDVSE